MYFRGKWSACTAALRLTLWVDEMAKFSSARMRPSRLLSLRLVSVCEHLGVICAAEPVGLIARRRCILNAAAACIQRALREITEENAKRDEKRAVKERSAEAIFDGIPRGKKKAVLVEFPYNSRCVAV